MMIPVTVQLGKFKNLLDKQTHQGLQGIRQWPIPSVDLQWLKRVDTQLNGLINQNLQKFPKLLSH